MPLMSRRSVLASATALTAPASGLAAGSGQAVRFGIVADPQYADAAPHLEMNRYYAKSLDRLHEAVGAFNGQSLHFVATLGDVIDRDWASFDRIMPIYRALRHGSVFVLGNHDFEVASIDLTSVAGRLGMPSPYYDFSAHGIRFIVLDGNDVSVFAPPPGDPRRALAEERLARLKAEGAKQAHPWNGSLGDAQYAWLEARLALARAQGERVIVLNHYPIYPASYLCMWDAQRLLDLLTGQEHVVAYLCGHDHAGNHGEAGGIHFVTFAGMVDTPDTNAYAIVEIDGDRMEITGFGREPSRSLRLKAA